MTGDRAPGREPPARPRAAASAARGCAPSGEHGKARAEPSRWSRPCLGSPFPGLDLAKIAPDDQDPHGAPMTPAQEAVAPRRRPPGRVHPRRSALPSSSPASPPSWTPSTAPTAARQEPGLPRARDGLQPRAGATSASCAWTTARWRAPSGPRSSAAWPAPARIPYLISGTDVALLFVTAHPERGPRAGSSPASGHSRPRPSQGSVRHAELPRRGPRRIARSRATAPACRSPPPLSPGPPGAPAPNAGPALRGGGDQLPGPAGRACAAVGAHDTPRLGLQRRLRLLPHPLPAFREATRIAALAVISDAAIARWCSARWRIADRRRVLARRGAGRAAGAPGRA